ncbi:hypothetical protein P154DRAFT_138679 [Amniculicola lignicola CBS 123094]|uniref:Uncharacterized protein n=1 Tax=Amniculicola lignicola CBS 123094 TaxID=1392246 RepID=A0A6A5WKG1_9PLEO|nr:hypothetical protein P154DRAFT_138679 [Amniculicola lignicola CBS 123094]
MRPKSGLPLGILSKVVALRPSLGRNAGRYIARIRFHDSCTANRHIEGIIPAVMRGVQSEPMTMGLIEELFEKRPGRFYCGSIPHLGTLQATKPASFGDFSCGRIPPCAWPT